MPIRLECPNPKCKVKLTVKEHLAGKRVPCPKCKHPIFIHAPVDLEALAAAALGDEPKPEQVQASTIDFSCPFCDEALHLPRALGGKQAPCPNPECRRIIKVPMPKDERPEDWRNLKRTGPSGARENVEAPRLEGAWDTSRSTVSGEALVEAGAIKEEKEPVTVAQWVRRGVSAAAAVLVLVVGVVGARWYMTSTREQSLLEQGMAYANEHSKLPAERRGALERLAGEYFLDAKQPEPARKHLMSARALLAESPPTERDTGLRELALSQTRLGETETVIEELRRTLGVMHDEEAKLVALRDVVGKLLAEKRGDAALGLTLKFGTVAPPPPEKGVKGDPEDEGDGQPKAVPAQVETKPTPPPAGALLPSQRIAVELALDTSRKASPVKERPTDAKIIPDPLARQGYVEGLARQDKYDDAVWVARLPGEPVDRLRAWLALADIAADAGKTDQANRYAHEALSIIEGELKTARISPWHAWHLARALTRAGGTDAKAREMADAVPDPVLKGRAQFELFLLKQPPESDAEGIEQTSLAYGLALEIVSRQKTRAGVTGEEQREWPEVVRPFVLLGVARGMQDAKR